MSNQQYGPDPRNHPYSQQPSSENQVVLRGPANKQVRSSDSGSAYVQSQYENYVDPAGNRVESQEEVFEDKNLSRANARNWITTVTYFILAVIEVILLLRLIFRMLGANQDNGFITFLYGLSHIFVVAFNGIFNDQTLGARGVFELSTLVAMLVYALLAWGVVSLGRVVFAPVLTGRQNTITTRRSR